MLTFDPEVGRAADAFRSGDVSGTLARVVRVVYDSVQLSSRPAVNVEVQRGKYGLEIILGDIWRLLSVGNGVSLVVPANESPIFEPDNLAKRGAFNLEFKNFMNTMHQRCFYELSNNAAFIKQRHKVAE